MTTRMPTLQQLADQARQGALEYYRTEQRFGACTIQRAWTTMALSYLSNAQDVGLLSDDTHSANDWINMAKVLLIDIKNVDHEDERRRDDARNELRNVLGEDVLF